MLQDQTGTALAVSRARAGKFGTQLKATANAHRASSGMARRASLPAAQAWSASTDSAPARLASTNSMEFAPDSLPAHPAKLGTGSGAPPSNVRLELSGTELSAPPQRLLLVRLVLFSMERNASPTSPAVLRGLRGLALAVRHREVVPAAPILVEVLVFPSPSFAPLDWSGKAANAFRLVPTVPLELSRVETSAFQCLPAPTVGCGTQR